MDLTGTMDLESDEPVACATPLEPRTLRRRWDAIDKEALMKTTDLIDQVADKAGIARDAARLAVDVMLTSIVDAAKKGEEVSLPGFGKFKVKQSPARQGRNPATGETIEIAAARKLGVRASETGEGRTRGLNTAKPRVELVRPAPRWRCTRARSWPRARV